jgi:hypothetical protein
VAYRFLVFAANITRPGAAATLSLKNGGLEKTAFPLPYGFLRQISEQAQFRLSHSQDLKCPAPCPFLATMEPFRADLFCIAILSFFLDPVGFRP